MMQRYLKHAFFKLFSGRSKILGYFYHLKFAVVTNPGQRFGGTAFDVKMTDETEATAAVFT